MKPKAPAPTLKSYEHDKYVTTKENLMGTLKQYGVAIIDNVLDKKECDALFKGFWSFLYHVSQNWDVPIEKDNPESWKEIYKLLPLHNMMIQHYSIGHAQFIWDVRQNEEVLSIFSELWCVPVDELLVSFDGASFHMPPEVTGKGSFSGRGDWLHMDQTTTGFQCVQSLVTALDVRDGDATLTILEGSHKHHDEFLKKFKLNQKTNWYKLNTQEQYNFYIKEKGCVKRCIKCPAGSMVFWDSRTIHAGQESLKEREEENFRAVAYLCFMPRELATEKDLEKKTELLEQLRTTTHWAHHPKVFGKKPRLYPGQKIPEVEPVPPPKLTEIGYSLAGY